MKLLELRNKLELDQTLDRDSYQYYDSECDKLKNLTNISISLSDFEGNKTKTMSLNKESLIAIIELMIRQGVK